MYSKIKLRQSREDRKKKLTKNILAEVQDQ